jgi:acetyl esterase/lipase
MKLKPLYELLSFVCLTIPVQAVEPLNVWPDLAPGESTRLTGTVQPFRAGENPPVTRVEMITRPTFTVHLAPKPNGAAVVILPGGGFGKVVPDKEGTEAAAWLNEKGIAAFVLSYRTKQAKGDPGWKRPLQDAQRMLALVRHRADEWGLKRDRIGLLGFSAGGHVATRLLTAEGRLTYEPIDAIDKVSHWPDFAILIYPWNIYDAKRGDLVKGVTVPKKCPPTFLVHTDDDRSSSLGSVLFYARLKKLGIPSELHVYGNGGHGYGLRPIKNSEISTWPGHAAHWLKRLLESH